MGRVTPCSLGEHVSAFVESQVKEGRYDTASDVMRSALTAGEESGPATSFDFEAFVARKRIQKPRPA